MNLFRPPRDLFSEVTARKQSVNRDLSIVRDPQDELARIQEQIWVMRARDGDHDSFQRLVRKYERRLLYFVRRFENDADRARDIVQDVWFTVFRKFPSLQATEAFRVWLYRIAHSKVATSIRRQLREADANRLLENSPSTQVGGSERKLEDAELVHRLLESVSADHREILTLRFLEDMRLREIADVLKCSVGTVKSRLHYAKQAFRQAAQELSDE